MAKWIKLGEDKFINVERLICVEPLHPESYLRQAKLVGYAIYGVDSDDDHTADLYFNQDEFRRLVSYLEHAAV